MLVALILCGLGTAWGGTFQKYSGTITEGDYIIYFKGKVIKNTISSNRLTYSEITPVNDVITTTDATIVWHIAISGSYWTLYNADVNKYAASTGTKNQAAMVENGTDDKSLWTINGNEVYEFVNKYNQSKNINCYLQNNGVYGFACYAKATNGDLTLYKKIEDNRTPVNLTSFSATSTTLIKNETTTTNITNDQSSWTATYTYSSDKESVATVDENGVITAVGKGIATITAKLNIPVSDKNYKAGETASMTVNITVNNPSHTATFSINGTTSTADFEEGTAVTFPASPADIEGKTFVGWTTTAIAGNTDEKPTIVSSATMGTEDIVYFAVYAFQQGANSLSSATLTANDSWNGYSEKTITDDKGNSWGGVISGQKDNNNVFRYGLTKADNSKSPYLTSPLYNERITEVKIVVTNGSTTKDRSFTLKDGETEVGTMAVSANTSDVELTASLNGTLFYQFTLTASDALQFKSISVTYGIPATYSAYCTTVLPPVAQIGTQKFETLEAAFAEAEDGATITLLKSCAGNGIIAPQGKFTEGLTVDFGGFTYTMDGTTVGSTGTETQAFQLLKDNKITFKNGTIYSEKALFLVQNYSDLTLEGMTLTLANDNYKSGYTLSNNNGNIIIDNTTINVNTGGGVAFDVCRYDSYPSVSVEVKGESVINGNIEVSASNNSAGEGFCLLLNSGTHTGSIVMGSGAELATITKSDAFEQVAPEGYKWVAGNNNTSTLAPCDYVAQIGTQKFETLEAAFAEAEDGATITLLKSCAGNGISVAVGKFANGLTVDFDDFTYTITGPTLAGSTGSQTQAFQLNKGNTITFKDGAIVGDNADVQMIIQNYANLTLDNMVLDATQGTNNIGYVLSTNNGGTTINNTTIVAKENGTAFDTCTGWGGYTSNSVEVTGNSVITGGIEVSFYGEGTAPTLTLTSGTHSGVIVMEQGADQCTITKADGFEQAAPEGYEWESNGYGTSTLKPVVPVELAAPIIFHDSGKYESQLTVPMYAQDGAEIYYSTDGENFSKYAQPLTISSTTTVTAYAMLKGVKSDEVSKTFTIVPVMTGSTVETGYYNIKTSEDKYVNVAGRKTVTLVGDPEGQPGTVISVETNDKGQLVELRSQGIDIPSYAEKAMNYVPELATALVQRLGANDVIGQQGADLLVDKFNKEFDYHLYLEKVGDGYRIFGRTPSMKPVVDFYAENKELIDSRLPNLESFVKDILQKIADKMGRGYSLVDMFNIHDIWVAMGGTLTNPEENQTKFYEEVLSSETNVWNFAHETMMIYWDKVKNYVGENFSELGDYGKYLNKVENIRPNFKYYIVPSESGVDFVSEGNTQILNNDANAIWTMTPCDKFIAKLNIKNEKNIVLTTQGQTASYSENYATLYTDFAYTLPETVKAYKITGINKDFNTVEKTMLKGTIPAQTQVLLIGQDVESAELTLVKDDASAPEGVLYGNDWLINKYEMNTPQLETIFALLTKLSSSLGEKYEHLKRLNAGTVNNKYFFGLPVPTEEGDFKEDFMNGKIKVLANGEDGIGFYSNYDSNLVGNEAFMFSEDYNPILLSLRGDVNRDGKISIADVTAVVDIILGNLIYPRDAVYYDFDAANANGDNLISVPDITLLVGIILNNLNNN